MDRCSAALPRHATTWRSRNLRFWREGVGGWRVEWSCVASEAPLTALGATTGIRLSLSQVVGQLPGGALPPSALKFAKGQHYATRPNRSANLRPIPQVSETWFGSDPRLFDRRVQRWLHRRRPLPGTAVLGGDRSGTDVQPMSYAAKPRLLDPLVSQPTAR